MAKYSIQIPEPCSEDWNQMTPLAKGRHCAVCQKTIYDFSNYTEDELVQHLQREGKICGRIPTKYLDIELSEFKANRGIGLQGIVAAAINLLVLTTGASMQGQTKHAVEQSEKDKTNEGKEKIPSSKQPLKRIVTGKVVDEDGIGLYGAVVSVTGTSHGVSTDLDGAFIIEIPEQVDNVRLYFSFIGAEVYQITVTDFNTPMLVTLKDIIEEEEVIITLGLPIVKKKKRWLFF